MNESKELDCHLVFVFNIHIENINNHLLRVRHIGLRQSRKQHKIDSNVKQGEWARVIDRYIDTIVRTVSSMANPA